MGRATKHEQPAASVRDRVVELVRVRAGDLAPHPKNWRTHPPRQAEALRGVLSEVGLADACVARRLPDGRLQLIDGHLRQSLDPNLTLPVLVLDVDEREADLLLSTMDPLAALAGVDRDRLGELLAGAGQVNADVQALLESIANQHHLAPDAATAAADCAPDPPRRATTQVGDMWSLGQHRLVCGDATQASSIETAAGGQPVRLVFTDPPYGVDYAGGPGTPRPRIENDGADAAALRSLLCAALTVACEAAVVGAPIYVCSADSQVVVFREALAAAGWRLSQTLVWVKHHFVMGRGDYQQQHEPILYGWKVGGGGTAWEARLARRAPPVDHADRRGRILVFSAAGQQAGEAPRRGDLQRRRDDGRARDPRRRLPQRRAGALYGLALRPADGLARASHDEAGGVDPPGCAQQQQTRRGGARPVRGLGLHAHRLRT